jgi:hypothetical protein
MREEALVQAFGEGIALPARVGRRERDDDVVSADRDQALSQPGGELVDRNA